MKSKLNVHMCALLIFGIICLAYLFVAFHRVAPAIMAEDIINETGVSATGMGALSAVFFMTFGLMQLPAGVLADSWGPRKTLPLFLTFAGVGSFFFAISNGIGLLGVGRALMGFGVSVIFVCGLKILTFWFPSAYYARMNGTFLGVGGIGMILGSGPMAYLCNFVGWRTAMTASGVITLIIAALIWVIVRNKPQEAGYPPVNPEAKVHVPDRKETAAPSFLSMLPSIMTIFSSLNFWLIVVWFCAQFAVHLAFGGLWAGTYLADVHHLNKVETGNLLNMMGIGLLVGAPFNGWLSDVIFRARKPVMLLNSFCSILLFLALISWGQYFPVWLFYIWFFLLAAFGMGSLAAGFASVRDIFGVECTGTASGFLNTFPSFVVAGMQTLSGYILEMYPKVNNAFPLEAYNRSMLLYLSAFIIALAAAFMVKEGKA